MYFLKTIGEIVEWAWVPGNAILPFEGGHQFEDLPVLRRRGKQKEKDYKYMVNLSIPFKSLKQSYCDHYFEYQFCFWQIPKSLLTAWKLSVEQAEYQLAARQKNSESVLPESINGDEHVPSPVPSENAQEALPRSADPGPTPSPNIVPAHNKHHCNKNSTVQSNKSNVCKKKKKCLSDIFGHIVGSSKESSAVSTLADKFHTTTHALREEPKDSPYADLDSVPILHRPKRTATSPIRDAKNRKEPCSAKAKTKLTEKAKDCSSILKKKSTETNPKHSLGTCKKLSRSSTEKHSINFPASCGLMTRALKTEEDADLIDALTTSQVSTAAHVANALGNTPIKTEPFPHWECPSSASSPTNHSSPKRRARKPDKRLIRNGSLIQFTSVGSSGSTEKPVRIKTEAVVPDLVLAFPSPSLPSVDAFHDVKELMFKSLANEDSSTSELTAFRPDVNYKFSTFLMLLKDIHDTREKEGKPLTIPSSPVLIKEEPLVIPASTGARALNGSCDGFTQSIKTENGQSEKSTTPHNSAVKTKNRTKALMSADTYKCKDLSVRSHTGSSDKQRRKQKLPAKLKLSIPGLSSDLADLAYGREFVSGHADLADPGSGSPVTTDSLVPYFGKNSESTVAPKKRWKLVKYAAENKDEVSADISGAFAAGTAEDLDLGVEKQAENDSNCSESSSTAGRTQTADVNINSKMIKKVICIF